MHDNYKNNVKIDIEIPAKYSSHDAPYDVEIYNELIKKKIIDGELIKIDHGECYDDIYLEKIRHHKKKAIRTYQLFGSCHWWNPTFCLTLAKIIYPNVKWYIIGGIKHTTISRRSEKYLFSKLNIESEKLNEIPLIFDILYFDENDEFFGGCKAINDTDDINLPYEAFIGKK